MMQSDEASAEVVQSEMSETVDTLSDASTKLVISFGNSAEAFLRGAFQVQNALVEAELQMIGTAAEATQAAGKQWLEAVRQGQEAALELVRASTRAVERNS